MPSVSAISGLLKRSSRSARISCSRAAAVRDGTDAGSEDERARILATLERNRWNRVETAKQLGLDQALVVVVAVRGMELELTCRMGRHRSVRPLNELDQQPRGLGDLVPDPPNVEVPSGVGEPEGEAKTPDDLIVPRLVRAGFVRKLCFRFRGDRADDPGAEHLGELNQQESHAPGRGMDQSSLAALERISAVGEVVRGHPLQQGRRRVPLGRRPEIRHV